MPAGEQFYRYGEADRLMAPVFYLGRRDWWQAGDWQAWLDALLAQRKPGGATTETGLAQRHNLGAFLSALYVAVQEQADDAMKQRLLPGLRKALKALG
jgi:broad specificity phosphatase PhoE